MSVSPPRVFDPSSDPRVVHVLRATAVVFALVTLVVAVLVLVGWGIDSPRLKSIIPGLVAMNPATAIAFILCGIAVMLQMSGSPLSTPLVRVLGAVVTILGALKLAGLVFHFPAEMDQFFFVARLNAERIPNRMAPNTALGFAL
ncbi:MAG TPA: hypothetical protein VN541_01780, partial [Tepidisphaeraceae bacterium]|nr:hypothetical protein [Tepidisphaeraceae bacterium]